MNNDNEKSLCQLCPRNCHINRKINTGFCNEHEKIRVAKVIKHFKWEEPCITGEKGCLAIFFSGCNLRCDYCQNYEISRGGIGEEYSIEQFIKLINDNQNSHSYIDLITPTHFAEQLSLAFEKIIKKIPVIWNSNSYETNQTIQAVSKFVDVFLADFKYADNSLAEKYSKCVNYKEYCIDAIKLMCKLKPDKMDNENMAQGVIIRHLVLPNHTKNSFQVLDAIKANFPNRKISLMSQFTPNNKSELNRKLKPIEYKAVLAHMEKLGLTNGYIQEFTSANSRFIPKFV